MVNNTTSKFCCITDHKESQLEIISTDWRPQVEIVYYKEKGKERNTQTVNLEDFIAIKGIKALGNKLTSKRIKAINLLESLPYNNDSIIDLFMYN